LTVADFSAAGGALAYRPAIGRTGIPVGFDAILRPVGMVGQSPLGEGITVIQNWAAGAAGGRKAAW
jgi:hypothetical protein